MYTPRIMRVLVAVGDSYDLGITNIVGKGQYRKVAEARRVAAYVMSKRLEMSTVEIGRVLHRDHSTVVAMLQKTKSSIADGGHEGLIATKLAEDK